MCEFKDCDNTPHYGFTNRRFCKKHKLTGMDYLNKRKICEHDGCGEIMYYGKSPKKYCKDHALYKIISLF